MFGKLEKGWRISYTQIDQEYYSDHAGGVKALKNHSTIVELKENLIFAGTVYRIPHRPFLGIQGELSKPEFEFPPVRERVQGLAVPLQHESGAVHFSKGGGRSDVEGARYLSSGWQTGEMRSSGAFFERT